MNKDYKYDNPYENINFTKRIASIKDNKGNIVFEQDVIFPDYFSDNAVNIVTSKYLCNNIKYKETDLKSMIDRVSNTITSYGNNQSYFTNVTDMDNFCNKLKYYQIHQYFAFNSPIYFNMGLSDTPISSACFILDLQDSMESIYDLAKQESIIFKSGSGSGVNMSNLRSTKERVNGSGFACLTGDTIVYTNDNKTITIKELYNSRFFIDEYPILKCIIDKNNVGYNKLEKVINNGTRPTYTLVLDNGYSINTTMNHRFLTEYGWCELSNIAMKQTIATIDSNNNVAFSHIKSISYIGVKEVFDLQMQTPFHNFIANNIVSHNSGPCSFLRVHDLSASVIKSGGILRRSAKLACLNIDHPDILKFIKCKENEDIKIKALSKSGIDPGIGLELSDHVFYQSTNISVRITDDFMNKVEKNEDFYTRYVTSKEPCEKFIAKDLLMEIAKTAHTCADPGVQFADAFNKWNTCKNAGEIMSTNPCIAGDTLIAVADGRNYVSIKQLADEGKDVDVYCSDNNNNLHIRKMVNPRKTGTNVNVFKVTFNDGSYIKVTDNHKFILKNGNSKRTDELLVGDSINILTKKTSKLYEQSKIGKNSNYYIWLKYSTNNLLTEHRFIYKYFTGETTIDKSDIIHHKDHNSLNNNINNLKKMNIIDHNKYHSINMIGDKNPMVRAQTEWDENKWKLYKSNMSNSVSGFNNGRYIDLSNDDIKNHAILLTQLLGRQFYKSSWYKYLNDNKLPIINDQFSKYRKQHLYGGFLQLSIWAARNCGYNYLTSGRKLSLLEKLIIDGYDSYIENDTIIINKKCKHCLTIFKVKYNRREIQFCSKECFCKNAIDNNTNVILSNEQKQNISNTMKKLAKTNIGRKYLNNATISSIISKSLLCGNMCIFLQIPIKESTWNNNFKILKENGIHTFITKNTINKYWNNNWDKFIKECELYNHKVTSIEYIGKEDVYNGTVDEFHNYFCIGDINIDTTKDSVYSFVNTKNCGEYAFINESSCNLASLNLLKFIKHDIETNKFYFDAILFRDVINTVIRAQDIIINPSKYPTENVRNNSIKYRPLGLGYSNLGATLMWLGMPYDSNEGRLFTSLVTALMTGYAYNQSYIMASELSSFEEFNNNKQSLLNVLSMHDDNLNKLVINENDFKQFDINSLYKHTHNIWDYLIGESDIDTIGVRNSQVTLIAPTGTISFLMDCVTTGCEPDYSIVKQKRLSGNNGTIKIVNGVIKESLRNIGYTEDQIILLEREILESNTFENSKILKEEHLPIFDTSVKSYGSNRCISIDGHLNMMASIQPFISMAISKTVNIDSTATVQDIYDIYFKAWKLGLKGITVYRDGCKEFQPLSSSKTECKENKSIEFPKPKKMPNDIKSIRHRFEIGGIKGYISPGLYDDGNIGELFIDIAKEGSTMSGLLNALAIVISLGIQHTHGNILPDIVEKLSYQKFEPYGFTKNSDIKVASSIVDYIARYLGLKYLTEEQQIELGIKNNNTNNTIENKIKKKTLTIDSSSICNSCGSIMIRKGTCFFCNNCGDNSGSCG